MVARLQEQLTPQGVRLQLTDAGRGAAGRAGLRPDAGARPLRRAIQRYIEDKLSDAMLERQFPEGTVVLVDGHDGDTVLTVNGEVVGGSVELPMVGLNEPVAQSVGGGAEDRPGGTEPPDAGSAGASA
jgi:ATP-dependent Clp protease ATP-binding subunit ClpC